MLRTGFVLVALVGSPICLALTTLMAPRIAFILLGLQFLGVLGFGLLSLVAAAVLAAGVLRLLNSPLADLATT